MIGRVGCVYWQQNQLNELIKRIYGRKSEKIDPNQLVFDDVILTAEANSPKEQSINDEIVIEKKVRAHTRRSCGGRKSFPQHLERIKHYLDIPEKEKLTADGKERQIIGYDISERLDYEPSHLVLHQYCRPKYGADDEIEGSGIKQHAPVEGPIDKCMAESGLLAHIIVEKYEHHTPLYRQELKFKRKDIEISRQTMASWMSQCAQVLKPLYDCMHQRILSSDIVLNDDTPVQMQEPQLGKTRTTRLWCTIGGENLKYTMYNFTLNRGRAGPSMFFGGYRGYFMCDDYSGYNELFKQGEIKYVSCWAHARRYFIKAQDTSPKAATEMLTLIARLYVVEKKHKQSNPKQRLEARNKQSAHTLKKIHDWLKDNYQSGDHLPQSPIYKAIEHTLKIWPNLCVYLEDGRIPIDNNLAENGIRPIALGRKNWLFIGSPQGGQTAAILMSFCATCRKNKINTWKYLKDVLQRINTHPISKINELLPDQWQPSS